MDRGGDRFPPTPLFLHWSPPARTAFPPRASLLRRCSPPLQHRWRPATIPRRPLPHALRALVSQAGAGLAAEAFLPLLSDLDAGNGHNGHAASDSSPEDTAATTAEPSPASTDSGNGHERTALPATVISGLDRQLRAAALAALLRRLLDGDEQYRARRVGVVLTPDLAAALGLQPSEASDGTGTEWLLSHANCEARNVVSVCRAAGDDRVFFHVIDSCQDREQLSSAVRTLRARRCRETVSQQEAAPTDAARPVNLFDVRATYGMDYVLLLPAEGDDPNAVAESLDAPDAPLRVRSLVSVLQVGALLEALTPAPSADPPPSETEGVHSDDEVQCIIAQVECANVVLVSDTVHATLRDREEMTEQFQRADKYVCLLNHDARVLCALPDELDDAIAAEMLQPLYVTEKRPWLPTWRRVLAGEEFAQLRQRLAPPLESPSAADRADGQQQEHASAATATEEPSDADEYATIIPADAGFLYRAHLPFHPRRLYDKVGDVNTFAGVLRSVGKLWLANRMDSSIEWSQVGNNITLRHGPRFWAAVPQHLWPRASNGQAPFRPLHWDSRFGDRASEIFFIGEQLDTVRLQAILEECLLHDDELVFTEAWNDFDDPFEPLVPRQSAPALAEGVTEQIRQRLGSGWSVETAPVAHAAATTDDAHAQLLRELETPGSVDALTTAETTVLVYGAPGAGKSTLLQAIARDTAADTMPAMAVQCADDAWTCWDAIDAVPRALRAQRDQLADTLQAMPPDCRAFVESCHWIADVHAVVAVLDCARFSADDGAADWHTLVAATAATAADTVVLAKTDVASAAQLRSVVEQVRRLNPGAQVVSAATAMARPAVLSVRQRGRERGDTPREPLTSAPVGRISLPRAVTVERFCEWVEALRDAGSRVYAKGLVCFFGDERLYAVKVAAHRVQLRALAAAADASLQPQLSWVGADIDATQWEHLFQQQQQQQQRAG